MLSFKLDKQDSALDFEFPTDATGVNFISDIYLQTGTDAMFVIARDFAEDGPTYLGAFDKTSGNLLTWVYSIGTVVRN